MIEFFFPQPQDLLPLRSGPLAPHLTPRPCWLSKAIASPRAGVRVRLVADLSQWLTERRIRLEEFDEHQTTAFFETRWKTYSKKGGELCTLKLLLWHCQRLPPGNLRDCRLGRQRRGTAQNTTTSTW